MNAHFIGRIVVEVGLRQLGMHLSDLKAVTSLVQLRRCFLHHVRLLEAVLAHFVLVNRLNFDVCLLGIRVEVFLCSLVNGGMRWQN